MKYELWYSVVVRDRHGKIVSRERRKSRSFLKAWNQLVYFQMNSYGGETVNDTAGIGRAIAFDALNFSMNAAAGVTTYGIRVGTGNTAVALDDYAVETPIAEGVGVGEMNHLICTVADYVVAAPSCSFVVFRSIVNNSAAEITVREAGIYMKMDTFFCCATRDVFSLPQAVPPGGTITVNWTIQVTV
ncbi:hypothetical protein ES703_112783 [subsurface metagenome]